MRFFREYAESPVVEPTPLERCEIALLPLVAVLFPGGLMSLKLAEQKYLDMVAACAKNGVPFGICLSAGGEGVELSCEPHSVGTLAHPELAEAPQSGHLGLTVRGGRRFRVLAHEPGANGLLHAQVELLPEPALVEVPDSLCGLLPLLNKVVGDLGKEKIPEPHNFADAAWVGYRLTEVVPVQLLAKQKLLELDDPISRLEILFKYFVQKGLLV